VAVGRRVAVVTGGATVRDGAAVGRQGGGATGQWGSGGATGQGDRAGRQGGAGNGAAIGP
ncbi:hypothetical protein E2562_006186, partial [Oryza meyeriana var. granulata]